MRTWAILSAVALAGIGSATAIDHPTERPPHISHCHAKVEKPRFDSKGPDSEAGKGVNNRSITTGVTLHCK
jgi:hypothetical protein